MENLWLTRRRNYHRQLLKYLRYVFNDHFVLALLFILGALAYNYSNFLKNAALVATLSWTKPLIAILLLACLSLGTLATFLQKADTVFLAAKEGSLVTYLKRSLKYSSVISLCEQLIIYLICCPYLRIVFNFSLCQLAALGLSQLILKELWLYLEYLASFSQRSKSQNQLLLGITAVIVFVGVYFPYFGLLVIVLFAGGCYYYFKVETSVVRWWFLVEKETERMMRLYRFFNLFTDVSVVVTKAKRRKYLDFLLPHRPTYSFLYMRGFLRSSDYLGMYLRLLLLGAALLYFVANYYLVFILAGLFLYLIGIQLFALEERYQEIVFTYMYPIDTKQRQHEYSGVLFKILVPVSIIFSAVILISQHNVYLFSLLLLILLLEAYLISKPYFNWRQRRLSKV